MQAMARSVACLLRISIEEHTTSGGRFMFACLSKSLSSFLPGMLEEHVMVAVMAQKKTRVKQMGVEWESDISDARSE